MSYRLFELPLALCPAGATAIQLLCQRDSPGTAIGQLWIGKNFAFSGSPPDSFSLLQTFSRFAWHGVLKANYPADTFCIDTRIGATIALDGPDLILDEVADLDAIAGAYWVIVDDEIMFLADPTMTAAGVYHINTVRGQYGTPIQDHTAGTDVYILKAADFAPQSFPTLLPGNVGLFKVTLGVQNVGDQPATTPGYVGSAFSIAAPHLVTVNGIVNTPIIPSSTNFNIAWEPAALNGTLPATAKLQTLIEIITNSTTYKIIAADPAVSQLITWANLPADANLGFTLQVTTQVDTGDEIISGDADSFFVTVSAPGLLGNYFNDPTDSDGSVAFTEPAVLTRIDLTLDTDWSMGSPGSAVTATNWSAIWTGILITPASAGSYAFTLVSDDGSRLYINGQLVIDNFGFAGGTVTQSITLAASTRYAIMVKYWDGPGNDSIHLKWQVPGTFTIVAVPSTCLRTA